MTWLWITALVASIIIKYASGSRFSLGEFLGVTAYLIFIWGYSIFEWILSRIGAEKIIRTVQRSVPQSVLDIAATYRLKPMEVALGFNRKKPIRVDFEYYHTIIAGVSGFGKTYMLVSILIQLFSKGARFTDYCDVYLFDYKADGDDYLFLWKPLVKEYYSITENNAEEAIEAILELANNVHDKPDKRILVIIDEVASISVQMKSEANDALMLLAGKLRSRGTLIVATQHPRYDIIPRSVTTNMSRKISLYVDDMDQANLILRSRPPKDMLPRDKGEFLLKEPGRAGYISGIGVKPNLPGDVQRVIQIAVPQEHSDPRVKFLIDTISGLGMGDSILGINRRVTEARKVGVDLKQKSVSEQYKLFEDAGIFSKPQKGGTRKIICNPTEAIKLLEKHLGNS